MEEAVKQLTYIPAINRFLSYCRVRTVPSKTALIHAGDLPDVLYYIIRGSVEVMIEDGRARPAGSRVDVPTGETVELVVMADSAGLIHVQPGGQDGEDGQDGDQGVDGKQIEYQPGTTTFALEMDRTGTVDVELRDPDLGPAPEAGRARLLVAARLGSTRLIDNVSVRL